MVYRRSELEEIDSALREARGDGYEHERATLRLASVLAELARAERKIEALGEKRGREAADVERLAGGVTAFLVGLFGSLDERRSKENDELAAAELELAAAIAGRELIVASIAELEARLEVTSGAAAKRSQLLERRQAWLTVHDASFAARMVEIGREEERSERTMAQLALANRCLQRAADALAELKAALLTAGAWSTFNSNDVIELVTRAAKALAVENARGKAPAVHRAIYETLDALTAVNVVVPVEVGGGIDLEQLDGAFVGALLYDWHSAGTTANALTGARRLEAWIQAASTALVARVTREQKQAEAWAREKAELVGAARR